MIVATSALEVERLNDLHDRGIKNNVKDLRMIGKDEIKEIEPHCQVIILFLNAPAWVKIG